MYSDAMVVRSEVIETGFGFYTDEDLRKISVCKITSPIWKDALGHPVQEGCYDARLGPLDQQTVCPTCSLKSLQCPGHFGHVELAYPVYNPMLFSSMFLLLRSKCAHCHKFRQSVTRVRHVLVKLKLLEMNDIASADMLDDLASPFSLLDTEGAESNKLKDLEVTLTRHEQRYRRYVLNPNRRVVGTHIKILQREVIDSFQKAAVGIKKCENCGSYSPSLRKDGYTKIFQKPLSKRIKRSLASLRITLKSAVEEAQDDEDENRGDKDDSDVEDDDDDEDDYNGAKSSESDKYIAPVEAEMMMKLLWQNGVGDILDFIFSRSVNNGLPRAEPDIADGWRLFFRRVVMVPPNRFRPLSKLGEGSAEHPQNIHIARIIEANEKMMKLVSNTSEFKALLGSSDVAIAHADADATTAADSGALAPALMKQVGLSEIVGVWISLQDAVNCYLDSAKDPNPLASKGVAGIRQILERKEGIFRMNMMGKRVNYCARSVISPDPYIGSNEVGIPVHFAKTLHYPTPVNDWNVKYLRKLVENGSHIYPGANQIEYGDGRVVRLERMDQKERAAKARLLLSTPGTKVYRHLVDGDVLLVNRQPTLHKPGIMAHRARVLKHVKEQTLRLSYANCNSYNADFDGDEMNCHFVQNEIARAEANFICNTDNQYILPTSGNPLRGLIQDHVVSGVKLTCKETFLTRAEFQQLVYIAVTGLPGIEIVAPKNAIILPPAAVRKPRELWTGKQVISALMRNLCRPPLPQLQLDGKTRTPPTAFGAEQEEHELVFRNGELLRGVVDKASIGNSSLGVVHAVYELYGAEMAGLLLNAFGRLFTYYLQDAGQTCGIEDLTLTAAADEQRRLLLAKVRSSAEEGLVSFLQSESGILSTSATSSSSSKQPGAGVMTDAQRKEYEARLAAMMHTTGMAQCKIKLDGAMQTVINKSASDVLKACIPGGLELPFLKNDFSMMVLTGAKGSAVNQSQISCFLGQQALEGMRVPVMISGKSLPSFRSYDSSARAGGFVQDRFLTGVKPQEYYFHCMAGREGLVDTAVKTSRSGYLQRCLVKHLEELSVQYDLTVRDSGGHVVQFFYGEDGLDTMSSGVLSGKDNQMLFLSRNNQALVHKYGLREDFFSQGFEFQPAQICHQQMERAKACIERNKVRAVAGKRPVYSKGSFVQARRKAYPDAPWSKSNILQTWFPAEVVKKRSGDDDTGDDTTFDLKYLDGVVAKKVPEVVEVPSSLPQWARKVDGSGVSIRLIKSGLPDPPMSSLSINNTIGSCSEKIQRSVMDYVRRNPDSAITTETTETTVTAESLEMLMWVKYMSSMACPGEAVGCLAAQGVGEPSTQMTLNTFHLAGHGGGNVTLGIPRLREILMTASRSPKTPTMLVPLQAGRDSQASAQALSRHLAKLRLSTLLSYKGGVEVGETMSHNSLSASDGKWSRVYRVRLHFESPAKIMQTFGVSFDEIVDSVSNRFSPKLVALIRAELKKSGDATNAKIDPLSQFKSKGSDEWATSGGGRGGNYGDDDESVGDGDDDNELEKRGGSSGGRERASGAAAKKSWDGLEDDSDADENEDEDEAQEDDLGAAAAKEKNAKEIEAYDEDDEVGLSDDDDDSIFGSKARGVKGKPLMDEKDEDDDMPWLVSLQTKRRKSSVHFSVASDKDEDVEEDGEENGRSKRKTATAPSSAVLKTPVSKGRAAKKTTAVSTSSSSSRKKLAVSFDSVNADAEEGWVELSLSFPANTRRLLMVQLAEHAAHASTIRETKGINSAYVVPSQASKGSAAAADSYSVQTDGVNFEAIWSMSGDLVSFSDIQSNDIYCMLQTYGVEAARSCIVSEVLGVFGMYGIDVNPRHLSLIADFMTRAGSYRAMNRIGMMESHSPFLQMSFETTCSFLTKAAQDGASDTQQSPSARLVLGNVTRVGTGCFDVMLPL